MPRQPFNDFLNSSLSGGPSSRGGGASPGGRGRGAPRGRGRGGGRQDYSAVPPVNYAALNKESYRKLEGFAPSPYENAQGASTPKRGRAFAPGPGQAQGSGHGTPRTPSGSATPVRGLGFGASSTPSAGSGRGSGFGGGFGTGRGRGRGGRLGGMMAELEAEDARGMPVFVKAGANFPAGEEALEVQAEDALVNRLRGNGMQVDDVEDEDEVEDAEEEEVDAMMDDGPEGPEGADGAVPTGFVLGDQLGAELGAEEEAAAGVPVGTPTVEDEDEDTPLDTAVEASEIVATSADGVSTMTESISRMEVVADGEDGITLVAEQTTAVAIDIDVDADAAAATDAASEPASPSAQLFFIDTTGAGDGDADLAADGNVPEFAREDGMIGQSESSSGDSEDEEILYTVPRTFAQPQPLVLPVAAPTESNASAVPAPGHTSYRAQHQAERQQFLPVNAPVPALTKKQKRSLTAKQAKAARRKDKKDKRRAKMDVGAPRRGDSDLDWGSEGSDIPEFDEEESEGARDYATNVAKRQATQVGNIKDDDESASEAAEDDIDLDALRAFALSMSAGNAMTIDDIADVKKMQQEDEEDGWVDSSGSEEDEEEEEDDEVPAGLGANRSAEPADASEEDSESDEDDDHALALQMAYDDLNGDDSDDDDDDDDAVADHRLFKGSKSSWAENSEDFIRNIEDVLDENAFMLAGSSSRKARNKLFKSIENGDFADDDFAVSPAPKGKAAKKAGIPVPLQAQWEKDRQKKADQKRLREMERIAQETSLYPAASKKAKGKAKSKGGFKYEDLAGGAYSAREMADMFDRESDSSVVAAGQGMRKRKIQPVTDLSSLNDEIKQFLRDHGKTTMTLPPMEKFSRKRVHELAQCYSLKSQSKGKGRGRFPVLIKTTHSTYESTDERKIWRIIGAQSNGDFYKAKYATGGKSKERFPGTAARSGGAGLRHMDGDTVGGEAERIGMDNIGHRLLSRMGWSEGDKIGLSGGLDIPIVAIVKNSKTGLGA